MQCNKHTFDQCKSRDWDFWCCCHHSTATAGILGQMLHVWVYINLFETNFPIFCPPCGLLLLLITVMIHQSFLSISLLVLPILLCMVFLPSHEVSHLIKAGGFLHKLKSALICFDLYLVDLEFAWLFLLAGSRCLCSGASHFLP